MKEGRYLYPDRVLTVTEYNGQLIFNIVEYETENRRKTVDSNGIGGYQEVVPDSELQH